MEWEEEIGKTLLQVTFSTHEVIQCYLKVDLDQL